MAMSKKEFLIMLEQQEGYAVNEWKSLKKEIPPYGQSLITLGKDEDGFFYHINKEFLKGDEEILIEMGVTDWQVLKD
ncbi:hypothetical protein IHV21_20460 [Acinetobacter baumannii]|uniref:hypothetical protein n=1 Tax=Acinetobacter baumannii TaxID=470 RepID=UPI00186B85E5|nr:hypothetical protein [Acinetobacter baumannii]MBE4724573.1 hypothetical protein [Acinetobacter baumannii]